jgi:UDP-N-acetylglucosamine 3-dehydrogenase
MRVGVIGVGNMGRHHARIWSEVGIGVELVATCDANLAAAVSASHSRARVYVDYEEMLDIDQLDAVSICVPTGQHAAVTLAALERGCHVLVEKPIAYSADAALEMMRAADKAGKILMVGHVERFNPAVKALMKRRDWLGEIQYVAVDRVGPMPANPGGEGLIVDLAVHDLDLISQLFYGAHMRIAYAQQHEQSVYAVVGFNYGPPCSLLLSWESPEKRRHMSIGGSEGRFELDFVAQTLSFWSGGVERVVPVIRGDSLRNELEIFAETVQYGPQSPYSPVSGRDGRRALIWALALAESAESERIIEPEELEKAVLEPLEPGNRQILSRTV